MALNGKSLFYDDQISIIFNFTIYLFSAVSPAKLIRTASTFNPAFHGYSQQDSMDFFRMMLDRLHEELKYPVPVDALDDSRASKASRRKSGRLASKESMSENEGVLHKSVISDTFGGTLRSEVKCHKCKKVRPD